MPNKREKMNRRMNKSIVVNKKENSVFGRMEELPIGIVEEASYKTTPLTTEVIKVIDFIKRVDIENSTNQLFSTKVKCDERDIFDEKIGKDICSSIVDRKYHDSMARRYLRVCEYLLDVVDELQNLSEYHAEKAQNIDDDLDRLYKKIDE